MKTQPNNPQFSWSNYFRPTPTNLQRFATAMRAVIGGIAGTTLLMEADKYVTFGILLAGYLLDEMIKFFGQVNDEENKRVITVEVPAETEVEVKDEVKPQ